MDYGPQSQRFFKKMFAINFKFFYIFYSLFFCKSLQRVAVSRDLGCDVGTTGASKLGEEKTNSQSKSLNMFWTGLRSRIRRADRKVPEIGHVVRGPSRAGRGTGPAELERVRRPAGRPEGDGAVGFRDGGVGPQPNIVLPWVNKIQR